MHNLLFRSSTYCEDKLNKHALLWWDKILLYARKRLYSSAYRFFLS